MLKFRFRVHASGWKAGYYENAHFAESEEQARKIIDRWNQEAAQRLAELKAGGVPVRDEHDGEVTLLAIIPITDAEFKEDYVGTL